MDTLLAQLGAIPGVVGSLLFDTQGQVTGSSFPPVFDPDTLAQLAHELSQDTYFQDWTRGEQASYELRFSEGWVAVRPAGPAWLMVLCTAQANAQLINMSLTQVVRRLRAPVPGAAGGSGASMIGRLPAPERLKALVRIELKDHAGQALDMITAAGDDVKAQLRAVTDIEKLTRLFIDRKKADELGKKMRDILMS